MRFNGVYSNIQVSSELKKGVSVFLQNAGKGKTFYFKLLSGFCRENGLRCYYGDYQFSNLSEETILSICQDSGSDVMILDNADLYLSTELVNKLRSLTSHLLISLHHPEVFKLSPCSYCRVYYYGDNMEVRSD